MFIKNLLFKGGLVLFDFFPGKFMEFRKNIHNPVFKPDLLPVVQGIVDLLSSHEDGIQLGIGGHSVRGTTKKKTKTHDEFKAREL